MCLYYLFIIILMNLLFNHGGVMTENDKHIQGWTLVGLRYETLCDLFFISWEGSTSTSGSYSKHIRTISLDDVGVGSRVGNNGTTIVHSSNILPVVPYQPPTTLDSRCRGGRQKDSRRHNERNIEDGLQSRGTARKSSERLLLRDDGTIPNNNTIPLFYLFTTPTPTIPYHLHPMNNDDDGNNGRKRRGVSGGELAARETTDDDYGIILEAIDEIRMIPSSSKGNGNNNYISPSSLSKVLLRHCPFGADVVDDDDHNNVMANVNTNEKNKVYYNDYDYYTYSTNNEATATVPTITTRNKNNKKKNTRGWWC